MSLYLDLLKQTLTRILFMEGEALEQRRQGLDWPGNGDAETMIGDVRLKNIEELAQAVLTGGIPGDFVECGVWRGGSTIFMAGILADDVDRNSALYDSGIKGFSSRSVWVCDSFKGCPVGNPEKYPIDLNDPHHTFKFLEVSLDEVKKNFERYGLLLNNVKFLEGWFKDTLPGPIKQISLLRMDGDMYESQTQILEALYDKVSPGGYVIVDDYYNIAGSHHAVNDFRKNRGIDWPLEMVDWCAAYWRKPL